MSGLLAGRLRPSQAAETLHLGLRRRVGFLPLDVPIAQGVERDRLAGDGAADEGARANDAEFAVAEFELGFGLPSPGMRS